MKYNLKRIEPPSATVLCDSARAEQLRASLTEQWEGGKDKFTMQGQYRAEETLETENRDLAVLSQLVSSYGSVSILSMLTRIISYAH